MKNRNALVVNFRLQAVFLALIVGFFSLIAVGSADAALAEEGNWTKKQYKIKGGWAIDTSGGTTVIRFNSKFKTKNGPDLKIFLSKKLIAEVTGKNATEESVLVAELKASKGMQEYVLPANIDIDNFKSLLIHCEAYSVLWGGSDIQI